MYRKKGHKKDLWKRSEAENSPGQDQSKANGIKKRGMDFKKQDTYIRLPHILC